MEGRYYHLQRKNTCYTEWKKFKTILGMWLWKINMLRYGWSVKPLDKGEKRF